jgi:hypothetical protein
LAQPAEALLLLCQHQDDDWDGSAEPDDLTAEPAELADDQRDSTGPADQTTDTDPADFEPSSDPAASQEASHRSLHITPTPFDPKRARPRAVVYVHLSEAALTAGSGVARVEEVGPVLLSRLHMLLGDHCSISLKPVIDLPPPAMSRSTAMRSRRVCGNMCCCVIRLMCFPTRIP